MKKPSKTEIVIPTWDGHSGPGYWGDHDPVLARTQLFRRLGWDRLARVEGWMGVFWSAPRGSSFNGERIPIRADSRDDSKAGDMLQSTYFNRLREPKTKDKCSRTKFHR